MILPKLIYFVPVCIPCLIRVLLSSAYEYGVFLTCRRLLTDATNQMLLVCMRSKMPREETHRILQ